MKFRDLFSSELLASKEVEVFRNDLHTDCPFSAYAFMGKIIDIRYNERGLGDPAKQNLSQEILMWHEMRAAWWRARGTVLNKHAITAELAEGDVPLLDVEIPTEEFHPMQNGSIMDRFNAAIQVIENEIVPAMVDSGMPIINPKEGTVRNEYYTLF